MDYTAQGHTVRLAQRMEQLAEAGRAYLTAETARFASGYFRPRDVGSFDLKAVSATVPGGRSEGRARIRSLAWHLPTSSWRSRSTGAVRALHRVFESP
jgi:class 3 adenylate cyclase